MEKTLKLINNNVVIRFIKKEKISEKGVIYQAKKDDLSRAAELVMEAGIRIGGVTRKFPKGTQVFVTEYAGKKFIWEDEECRLVKATDITAIVSE